MDIPSAAWLVDQEMEDPREFINQHQQTRPYNELMDSLSSVQCLKGGYQQDLQVTRNPYNNIHAAGSTINHQDLNKEEINYKLPTTSRSFGPICGASSSSNNNNTFTISFGDFTTTTSPTTINKNQLYGEYKLAADYHNIKDDDHHHLSLDELLGSIELPKRLPTTRRNHRQAQEHVLAERKRREKLTQRFISLSALLPEIKKMDKATVLEDASKYIKQLQNRVKELEDTTSIINRKSSIRPESTTCSMRRSILSKFHDDEHDATSFDDEGAKGNHIRPGIKVRISGSNILVRIYCQRNSSLAVKALTEMERLHLTIMCNSVFQISATASLITIIAQMNEEFVMTAMDLVRCLQSSLSSFL